MSQHSTRKHDATNGRTYGGDTGLVHIQDGKRQAMGKWLATQLSQRIRMNAVEDNLCTYLQSTSLDVCPGCYQVALFNAAIELAKQSHQPLSELGRSMAAAFQHLADHSEAMDRESIEVMLDP